MRHGVIVGLLWVLGCAGFAQAEKPKEHPAKADLVAGVSTLQPGQAFHVAVRITMQPHWHVYWINPGDSGQATEIKWKAPEGYEITPLPFPTPVQFMQPGDIAGYGYEGSVLFMASVTPPADAKGPIEISANVEWLVCNPDMCLPGKASPKVTLEVGDKPVLANESLIVQGLDRMPQPYIDVVDASVKDGIHELKLNLRKPAKNLQVFPAPPGNWSIENAEITAQPNTSLAVLKFKARPIGKERTPLKMPVLIAYDDESGVRRGLQFDYAPNP